MLSLADPTVIALPQAHLIFAFGKYFGCISAFILDYNSKNHLKRKEACLQAGRRVRCIF